MKRALCLAGLLLASLPAIAAATDPPHGTAGCNGCHMTHAAPGGSITAALGNANLCQSCHVAGGAAAAKPLAQSQEARPWPGLRAGELPSGTSHRWDSSAAGYVATDIANRSVGTARSTGAFTGRYAKTFTLTVAAAGNVGTATFTWADTLGGSGAAALTSAQPILLNEGVRVFFSNGLQSPSFVAGDRFYIYVRPDLNDPTDQALALRLEGGQLMCSTCHDQHSQAMAPFGTSPAYQGPGTGAGRHFMRLDNQAGGLCAQCHAARVVTAASSGSHPVGLAVPTSLVYKQPAAVPLDAAGRVQCMSCHALHYAPASDGYLLRSGGNALCSDCHTLADTTSPAKHFNATTGVLWPGGQYGTTFPAITDSTRRGTCANCHSAHGWPDAANVSQDYPSLLVDREEKLCFTCHDGSPVTKNVRAQYQKTYRHPTELYAGRHDPKEAAAASFGSTNRHAECVDCHSPHQAAGDATAPVAPSASRRLAGVARVSVTNGAAGTVPTYTYRAATDATPMKEFELCFKCHSSWTTQPTGQTNLALKLNPNNPSFHPVEAAGKNSKVNANAFVNGWTATKTTYCADCHTSDDATVRGPHGSANRYLLKKPYTASSASRTMASTESCFDCHRYDTYANDAATSTLKGYSRFNPPAFSNGHTFHVGQQRYPCYACHETHGSTVLPALLVTGRNPGITSYSQSPTGGTCTPTCHGQETYTLNYAR